MLNPQKLIALAVAFGAIGAICAQGGHTHALASAAALAGKPAVQKATIVVDNAFKPSTLKVKAGQPVELTFYTKHRGCATAVVFDDLKLRKDLKDGTKTVFKFTPKKAGKYAFACPMKMMKGTLIVR